MAFGCVPCVCTRYLIHTVFFSLTIYQNQYITMLFRFTYPYNFSLFFFFFFLFFYFCAFIFHHSLCGIFIQIYRTLCDIQYTHRNKYATFANGVRTYVHRYNVQILYVCECECEWKQWHKVIKLTWRIGIGSKSSHVISDSEIVLLPLGDVVWFVWGFWYDITGVELSTERCVSS